MIVSLEQSDGRLFLNAFSGRGFRFWHNPGAINTYLEEGSTGRFLAVIGVIVQAAFAFQGVELVGIAAAETKSPRRNIAKSCHRVFYKILTLYMLSILTIGWTVPSYDPRLLTESGNAGQSPFVIAMEIAGIRGLPHFANALFFSSAFSAGNAYLYSASRILYGGCHFEIIHFGFSNAFQGLSLRGQAPRIFAQCTASGLPLISVIFCVGRPDLVCRTAL